jgi:hypothetical protein
MAHTTWLTPHALPALLVMCGAAESALYDVVALLDAATAAKAEPLAAEFLEYLDAMDYNKYFDAMPTRTVSQLLASRGWLECGAAACA